MSRRRTKSQASAQPRADTTSRNPSAPLAPGGLGTTVRPARVVAITVAAVAVFALGVLIGARVLGSGPYERCAEDFAYVNPRLACGRGPVISKRSYDAFRASLGAAIDGRVAHGSARSVSVYFRDLVNGPSFGIREDAPFVPASLLKLPLVLAFLDMADDDPGLLARTLVYDGGDPVPEQNVPPEVTLRRGEPYSIETLLANTARFSDNASYLLLRSFQRSLPGGDDLLLRAYRELGIVNPTGPLDQTVTVRGYAALFRLLYNGSYLSMTSSERVLSWLAESAFAQGIVAGVPAGIPVAHKFGERSMSASEMPSGPVQLHDCGIVYFPENPYLLCVMTRGEDLERLVGTVRSVSEMVYAEVASRAREQRE
mgnify:CR=1 FL=1